MTLTNVIGWSYFPLNIPEHLQYFYFGFHLYPFRSIMPDDEKPPLELHCLLEYVS